VRPYLHCFFFLCWRFPFKFGVLVF
jgi:hypothetical protein